MRTEWGASIMRSRSGFCWAEKIEIDGSGGARAAWMYCGLIQMYQSSKYVQSLAPLSNIRWVSERINREIGWMHLIILLAPSRQPTQC